MNLNSDNDNYFSSSDSIEQVDFLDENIISRSLEFRNWLEVIDSRKDASTSGFLRQIRENKFSCNEQIKEENFITKFLRKIIKKFRKRKFLRILDITHLCNWDTDRFWHGWVDCPVKKETIKDSELKIAGWIVGKKDQPIKIRISVNKNIITETTVSFSRPDVSEYLFLMNQKEHNWGFCTTIFLQDLPSEGLLSLDAVFINLDVVPMATIEFIKD